jgi:LPS export ABC transporter protein LptC
MMKTKRKTLIIVAIMVVILSVAVIFAIVLRKAPEKALLKIMADKVDLQIKNVRYTEVGDSGMKWEITADTARYQKMENLAFFEKVTVRLVMEDGRIFVMKGDRGRFNTQSRDMDIEGNVGIVSETGERLTTDRLSYLNAGKRIETDQPVVMENGTVRISGVGMIFPLEEKKVTILGKVRAISAGIRDEKNDTLPRKIGAPSAGIKDKKKVTRSKKVRAISAGKRDKKKVTHLRKVRATSAGKRKGK